MLTKHFNKAIATILIMCIVCTSLIAQNQTTTVVIKGKITDEKGEGVPFANVRVLGTLCGYPTDFDGFYEFKCSLENFELVNGLPFFNLEISALGYDDKTIPVIITPSTEPIVVAEINNFLSIAKNIGEIEITRCYRPLIDKE